MEKNAITLAVGDGEAQAIVASPEEGGPGVLVLHAWWGLTPFFKSLCKRLAEAGFVALAPDLYQGQTAQTVAQAEQLEQQASEEEIAWREQVSRASVQALLALPEQRGSKIGVVGFSAGAWWAAQLAAYTPEQVGAVVLCYGTVAADFEQVGAAFQGHFGEVDAFEPLEFVKEMEQTIRDAGGEVTIHMYPEAGHWFMESDRPDAYAPEAADLAWARTVAFLQEQLG
jgi:carboxymethylenebutenolidase